MTRIEDVILAKACKATLFTSDNVHDEAAISVSFPSTKDANSSDKKLKHPAAKIAAFNCTFSVETWESLYAEQKLVDEIISTIFVIGELGVGRCVPSVI